MRSLLVTLVLGVLAAVLTACGGGGADSAVSSPSGSADPNSISMSFSPSSLEVCYEKGVGTKGTMTTTLTITPEPEAPRLYAFVLQDKPVLDDFPIEFWREGPGKFHVGLRTSDSLSVGQYRGTFSARLCRDALCKDEIPLSGNSIAYSIDVLPQAVFAVDGVPAAFGVNGKTGTGKAVVITSTIPMIWSQRDFTVFDIVSSTPTRLEVIMDTNYAGWLTGRPVSKCGLGGTLVFNR